LISGPLRARPRIVGAALRATFDGLWRARRGKYRVRYRSNETTHEVVVLDIDQRRCEYRS